MVENSSLLPDKWSLSSLQEHCMFETGKLDVNAGSPNGIYPFFTCADDISHINYYAWDCPAILIAGNGNVGNAKYYEGKFNAYQRTYVLTDFHDINTQYLYHYIVGTMQDYLRSIKIGSTLLYITLPMLQKFPIALPPLPEQERIASILGDLDDLIEKQAKIIDKKKRFRDGMRLELLTMQSRLPGFDEEWKEINLGEASIIKARIGWQGLTTAEYLNDGYALLITAQNFLDRKVLWNECPYVLKNRYDQDPNIQLKEDDVLVSKDGTLGKVAYVDELPQKATLNSGVFVIRPKKQAYDPLFLSMILRSELFKEFLDRLSAGSTIVHLYQKDIVKFSFFAPPTIEEQKEIGTVLSNMDDEIEYLQDELDKSKQLKAALLHQLIAGETRTVNT